MSILESYSILCELLPMYDYLDHWCWLMNQLSKKTRQIWKDYRLAFKHLDRETMTVMRYDKEFDDHIADLLLKSSILSCMSFNVWLNSDESFDRFVSMMGRFCDDKVVCFEFCGHKTNKYTNFISEIDQQDMDQNIMEESDEKIEGSIICINSLIEFNIFEYKLKDKYSEYHPFSIEPKQLSSKLKTIISSHSNNPKIYFTRARGSPEIFVHTHNLPDFEDQKIIGKQFSCCDTCIKCSQSGVCEIYVDDFIDGNINCFESMPKTHIVFREKTEPLSNDDFELDKPIELKYPELKSVTYKSDKMDFRSIYRFLSTNTDAQVNIEMRSKNVKVCYACDSYSILYFWNVNQNKLQAYRFDSFIISVVNIKYALQLDKPKSQIKKSSLQDQSKDTSESIENKSGFFAADVISSNYLRIANLKPAYGYEEPPFDYSNINTTSSTLQLIFFKADINSCYCMSQFARAKPEVKQEPKKEEYKQEAESNQKEEDKTQNKEPKPIPMLASGRRKGFYRKYMYFYEFYTPIDEIKKQILEIDERRDIFVMIRFNDNKFNDTSLIDFLFSRRLTSIELGFTVLEDQNFLNYIADKIEEHSSTLFEVCCSRENGGERKGFFNITSAQRKKICDLIRNRRWNEEVINKTLFRDITYVHSYQIHDD